MSCRHFKLPHTGGADPKRNKVRVDISPRWGKILHDARHDSGCHRLGAATFQCNPHNQRWLLNYKYPTIHHPTDHAGNHDAKSGNDGNRFPNRRITIRVLGGKRFERSGNQDDLQTHPGGRRGQSISPVLQWWHICGTEDKTTIWIGGNYTGAIIDANSTIYENT